jgi:hypothetical protein
MNAFDAQAIADEEARRRRLQLLNVAAILAASDQCVADRVAELLHQLSEDQLARVERAARMPNPQRTSTLQRILREAHLAKPRKRKRRGGCRR